MSGLTAGLIAAVCVFLLAIFVAWLAARLSDRLEQKAIRDEWAEITRVAEVVPETGWGHVPVTDEEATEAFIAYLAEKTDTWLAANILEPAA
jgi:hypothetical protein